MQNTLVRISIVFTAAFRSITLYPSIWSPWKTNIIVSESERYLDRTVRLMVMSGNRWLRIAKMASRQLGIEAKNPSNYVRISLTDVITKFYITQYSWLCLNYNLAGVGPLEALGRQEYPRGLVFCLHRPQFIHHNSFPYFDEICGFYLKN